MPSRDARRLAEAMAPVSRMMKKHMGKKHPHSSGKLSHQEFHALDAIGVQDRPTLQALSASLQLTPSATSTLVNGLVERGYLTRKPDPKDRRAVHLSLTKKGRNFLEKKLNFLADGLEPVVQSLKREDLEQFIRILNTLR